MVCPRTAFAIRLTSASLASGHDAYFGCQAVTQSDGTIVGSCVPNSAGQFGFYGFSGTSASAPSMAAVTAILNGRTGTKQGNLNPLLYRLFSTPANGVFHDVTVASSGVSGCSAATASICNNSTPSATGLTGGLAGYLLTPGYDLATGLGSLDVNNLLTASVSATGTATTTTLTGTSGKVSAVATLTFTAVVAPKSGSGTPSGSVQFFANGNPFGSMVTLVNGSATLTAPNTLSNGDYTITAVYSGDSNFQSSTSGSLSLTSFPGGTLATTSVLVVYPNPTTPNLVTNATFTVSPTGSNAVPTGTFTLYQLIGGSAQSLGTVALTNGTVTAPIGSVPVGTYTLNGVYSGDSTYAGSTSSNITLTSVASIPTTTVLSGPASVASGTTPMYSAIVSGLPSGVAVTSTVNLLDNGNPVGAATLTKPATPATNATVTFTPTLAPGPHSLTAMYVGEANTASSTSTPALAVTVAGTAATSATALSGPTSVTAGISVTYTATVTGLNASAADSATVNLLDGASNLGTATLTKAAGTATSGTVTFNVMLPAGPHSLTAMYLGDANSTASHVGCAVGDLRGPRPQRLSRRSSDPPR